VGQRIVVVAGGERVPTPLPGEVANAIVVAADSGLDGAFDAGLPVSVAIGDFDSVSSTALERAGREGVRIERHPAEKDQTDLELALHEAIRLGATDVIVLGIGGGRQDHLLANLLVLGAPFLASCRVTAYVAGARVHVVRGGAVVELVGAVGETVTLVPVGGPGVGITTTGLKYSLRDDRLEPGTTRGVSNVIEQSPATVALAEGVLLAILPGQGAS
jgi:thiamine pyrophosphokinase